MLSAADASDAAVVAQRYATLRVIAMKKDLLARHVAAAG